MKIYKKEIKCQLEVTIIKLLYRCLLGYSSIQKCNKIFVLDKKQRKIYTLLLNYLEMKD